MRVVIGYCKKDEDQAIRLASWMGEIGPYHDHSLLVARDKTSSVTPFKDIGFGEYNEFEVTTDAWRRWPQSCNNVFGECARFLEALLGNPPFLWLEPDVAPFYMKDTNFVSAIEREYAACGKPFLGDWVSVHTPELDVPDHMSGVAVYPSSLIDKAGMTMNAHDWAWDVAGRGQIVPNMAVSKLIKHTWKHPAFSSPKEIQDEIFFHKPGCVLFHADKSGSLINLLRQQKAGVVPITISSPEVPSLPSGVTRAAPATVTGKQPIISVKNSLVCDIFIKSYPPDYARLDYCLQSINKFCTGFRKVVIVVPERQPLSGRIYESDFINVIPVVEYGEGYLFQQAVKASAHEFTDAEYILHIDSDTMFTRPVTPDSFFRDNKLLWLYTPYSEIETPWQDVTTKFIGQWQEFEFMRRLPLMIPRWLHRILANFCLDKHGIRLWDYIMTQPSRAFSEFNALGALAWKNHSQDFTWLNTTKEAIPPEVALQRWSGGPWDEATIAECEQILSAADSAILTENDRITEQTPQVAVASQNGFHPDLTERRRAQAAHARAVMAAKRASGWKPAPRGPSKKKRKKRRI